MELSQPVKEYIEKNIDLLDLDPLEFARKGLHDSSIYKPQDKKQFFEVLTNTLDILTDLDEVVYRDQQELTKACEVVKKKYGVAGVTGELRLTRAGTAINAQNICDFGLSAMEVGTVEDNTVPSTLPSEYTFITSHHVVDGTVIQLEKNGIKSAALTAGKVTMHVTLKDLYNTTFLQPFIVEYEELCKNIKSAINTCIKTFQWKNTVEENLAPQLLTTLNDVTEDIFGKKLYKIEYYDNYVALQIPYDISKQTNIQLSAYLYFDKDPSNIDIDATANDLKTKLIKFKTNQDKKAANAAARESNRKERGLVNITRKDVTAAIRAAGFTPSDFVYTNKYANSTTYKYQFMNLTPSECKLVEDELIKRKADVISVTTQSSDSWRGPYNSLFVKIRN